MNVTVMNPRLELWKRSVGECSVVQDCVDEQFWIEENTNYPVGEGNLFLMYGSTPTSQVFCVGGVDRQQDQWVASITSYYDEETDSDCQEVFRGHRADAISALWRQRHLAYCA